MLIRVVTLADLINKVNLMLNCILIIPYIIVLSFTPMLSLLNAKNWLYPTVDYLDAFILIIIPTYKVICSIAGYKYGYIIDKGVLVSYKRHCIIYSCN